MDPRERVTVAIDEGLGDHGRVRIAPPQRPPARSLHSLSANGQQATKDNVSSSPALIDIAPSPEDERPVEPPEEAGSGEPRDGGLPGVAKGRQRVLWAYLPQPTYTILERTRLERGEPRGVVAMAAVRGAYEAMAEERAVAHQPSQGPFGPPYRPRQRRDLEDARNVHFSVAEHEAAGIAQACDALGLSMSALFTEAIDRYYGSRGADGESSGRR